MTGQLEGQDHLIFSCVVLFVLRQGCHKHISAALRIVSEIPNVGNCKGTKRFLSQFVVMLGEELVHVVFMFGAGGNQERFY